MNKLAPLLVLFAAIHSANADPEMDRLKASYDAAVERSVAPLRATYEKELLKLMEKHTKAGDLTAALKVKDEIEKLTGKPVLIPTAAPSGTGAVARAKVLEPYFVGKTWRTPTGTSFTFREDGTGDRQFGNDKSAFKWKQRGRDTVEAIGPGTSGGADRSWFFRFESLEEAFYGNDRDTTNAKLTLQK
ncbi:MAG: hypothetical protein ACO1TE_07040 [Prosthecobacter sp.]